MVRSGEFRFKTRSFLVISYFELFNFDSTVQRCIRACLYHTVRIMSDESNYKLFDMFRYSRVWSIVMSVKWHNRSVATQSVWTVGLVCTLQLIVNLILPRFIRLFGCPLLLSTWKRLVPLFRALRPFSFRPSNGAIKKCERKPCNRRENTKITLIVSAQFYSVYKMKSPFLFWVRARARPSTSFFHRCEMSILAGAELC